MMKSKVNNILFMISLVVTVIDFILAVFVFPPFKLDNIICLGLGVIPVIFSFWVIRNKDEYDDYKAKMGLIVYCLAPIIFVIKEVFGLLFELDFSDLAGFIIVIYPLVIPFIIHAYIYFKEKSIENKIMNKK